MHTFQPMPIDLVELNPFTKIGKEWALVTAGTKGSANTMTISWGGVGVLWGKNVAFIFVRDSRYTKELLDANEFFSITFLSEQYRDALNYCGSHSGRDGDKIAAAGLTLATRHNIPYIDEGNFVFLCEKMSATRITEDSFLLPEIKDKWYKDGDMHTMYIAEIIDLMAR
ncbi:MAG: flavin reductase [Roseburia sp.]|nr:flavin reductase [Roseburia sp.]